MTLKKNSWFSILFVVLILFFPSCKQQKRNIVNLIKSSPEKVNEFIRHSDIPLPINFRLAAKNSVNKDDESTYVTSTYHYTGNLPLKDIVSFYLLNMEQFGWEVNDLSTNEEVLLYCSKNRKYCAISARQNLTNKNFKTSIYIFTKIETNKERKRINNSKDENDPINSKKLSQDNISPSGYLC